MLQLRARMRFGRTHLRADKKGQPPTICKYCQLPDTQDSMDHIIICPHFHLQRQQLLDTLTLHNIPYNTATFKANPTGLTKQQQHTALTETATYILTVHQTHPL